MLLLLQGARELGDVVRQNILDLQRELRELKKSGNAGTSATIASDQSTGETSSSSGALERDERAQSQRTSGALTDRFTNESVVLNAPSKVKAGGGSELQV